MEKGPYENSLPSYVDLKIPDMLSTSHTTSCIILGTEYVMPKILAGSLQH